MRFWHLDIDFNSDGSSPWDALWHDGDDSDFDALFGQMKLSAFWHPPHLRLERRIRQPDVYGFNLFFVVTNKVMKLFSDIKSDDIEFLPIRTSPARRLFIMHPLSRVDLDYNASCGGHMPRDNIVEVDKWVFPQRVLNTKLHVFQVYQAPGSAARDAGFPLDQVFISEMIKQKFDSNQVRGIKFLPVSE